jgi:hypothetical protein
VEVRRIAVVVLIAVVAVATFLFGRSTAPASHPRQPDFSEFAGTWYWHGQVVNITPGGEGTASWRVYKWCRDDPSPPCDGDAGNEIVDGGNAAFVLRSRDGGTARGTVIQSSDTGAVPVGDIALVLMPNDHLQFPGLGNGPLCGPNAPSDCGA